VDAAFAGMITPVILTFNEAPNLARCLDRLTWARQIIVLDSGSTDETREIAAHYPNVQLLARPFDNHASQWNAATSLVETPWVLSLDADYIIPPDFVERLPGAPDEDVDAYSANFRYCIFGRPLMGSLYPPRDVLFRRERCHYENDGHTQRLRVPGKRGELASVIDHDDRKPLSRWFQSQISYTNLEAEKLLSAEGSLSFVDRLRRGGVFAPPAVFFYTLIVKGTILDGWRGWFYTLQRTTAEIMLALAILERRINQK
jgi:glycosyltransferase involved in cell wall biosynthesis